MSSPSTSPSIPASWCWSRTLRSRAPGAQDTSSRASTGRGPAIRHLCSAVCPVAPRTSWTGADVTRSPGGGAARRCALPGLSQRHWRHGPGSPFGLGPQSPILRPAAQRRAAVRRSDGRATPFIPSPRTQPERRADVTVSPGRGAARRCAAAFGLDSARGRSGEEALSGVGSGGTRGRGADVRCVQRQRLLCGTKRSFVEVAKPICEVQRLTASPLS